MRYLLALSLAFTMVARAEPVRGEEEGPLRYPYPARVRRAVDDSAAARSWQNISMSVDYVDPCCSCWGGGYYYGNYSYVGYGAVWGYRPLGLYGHGVPYG